MTLINTVDKNKIVTEVTDHTELPQIGSCHTSITLEFDSTKLASHGQDMMSYMEGFVQAIDDDTKYIWNKRIEYKVRQVMSNLLILEIDKVNLSPVSNFSVSNDTLFSKLLGKVSLKVCTVKDGEGVVDGSLRNATVNDSYLFNSKYSMISELNKNGTAIGNGVNVLYKDGEDIKQVLMNSYVNSKDKAIQTILTKLLGQMVQVEQKVL